ncbi:MAG TPA: LysM peptidoglycan-binding domain-containing C40 family peptidase [Candidatus Binatia bacterium]|nr:LysM peptidoglycan-binding domain-containing C40 family peptidase [Candidatus Binatia bacterium]
MHRPLITALFALVLVAVSASFAEARTHRVSQGETLASIAASEHVMISDLARLNDLEGDNPALAPGEILVLDAASAPAAPDPAAAAKAIALVKAAERASVPTAGADVAMWQPSSDDPSPLHRFASRIIDRTSSIASTLARNAMRFLGVPYSFGGTSSAGFDCSGYVQHVFAMLGIHLPRTADSQFARGERVHGGDLQPGDLVFFQTYAPGASHVGIYLGNDEFVHASSSRGVMVSKLSESYWATRYIGAKRVVANH